MKIDWAYALHTLSEAEPSTSGENSIQNLLKKFYQLCPFTIVMVTRFHEPENNLSDVLIKMENGEVKSTDLDREQMAELLTLAKTPTKNHRFKNVVSAPILDLNNRPIGQLLCFSIKPIGKNKEVTPLAEFVGTKIGLELSRLNLKQTLIEQENNYQSRLKQSMALIEKKLSRQNAIQKIGIIQRMVAGLAHEIKNPLNFVQNASSIIQDETSNLCNENDPLNPTQRESVENLVQVAEWLRVHSQRIDRLIKKLMKNSDQINEIKEEYQLQPIVFEITELLKITYHGNFKNIPVVSIKCDQIKIDSIDKKQFERIYFNLVDNAFKAMQRKEILQKRGNYIPAISIKCSVEDEHVLLIIKDNGIGIESNDQRKIFEEFYSPQNKSNGVGMGLAMAKNYIESCEGSIKVESTFGKDTTFTVTIPLHLSEFGPKIDEDSVA